MFAALKKIFAVGPKVDLATLITDGALIIDVRTPAEFSSGHLKKAINIPLGKKDRPIITCCASGMRSRSARSILRSNGFGEVYNGGSWQNLRKFEQ
jgi:phage shock protein E